MPERWLVMVVEANGAEVPPMLPMLPVPLVPLAPPRPLADCPVALQAVHWLHIRL